MIGLWKPNKLLAKIGHGVFILATETQTKTHIYT